MADTRLTRDTEHAIFGGVCAGIAARYDFDRSMVRVVTVLLTILTGGLPAALYIAAWLIMPTPETAAEPPARVARENANDVIGAAKRTASTIVHTNPDEVAEQTRRAAREVGRVAEDAARAARTALDRNSSRGGAATEAGETSTGSVATAPRPTPARPAARPGGGFKPPSTSMPPSSPKPPFGEGSN
ncbi:MAG: PspC domain-containing protein [Dehalococcoidia bacterium]